MSDPLTSKTWEELEAIEQGDRLLFPDQIHRRGKTGDVDGIPIMVRVLRKNERRAARLEAREWAKRAGVDTEKDPQLFDDMDTLCILARAIRDFAPPHAQFQKPEWLEEHFDDGSLGQIWDRYPVYESLVDPRISEVSEEQVWKTILEIGRSRSVRPLTEFAPRSQHSLLLCMVDAALISPICRSFLERHASSIAEP